MRWGKKSDFFFEGVEGCIMIAKVGEEMKTGVDIFRKGGFSQKTRFLLQRGLSRANA